MKSLYNSKFHTTNSLDHIITKIKKIENACLPSPGSTFCEAFFFLLKFGTDAEALVRTRLLNNLLRDPVVHKSFSLKFFAQLFNDLCCND